MSFQTTLHREGKRLQRFYSSVSSGNLPQSSLISGLIEWWSLAEGSGSRSGSQNALDLTDHNGVSGTSGVTGNASNFVHASSQYLSRFSSSSIQNNSGLGFEFCAWVRPDDYSFHNPIVTKDTPASLVDRQYSLFVLSTGVLYCEVHNTSGTSPIAFASTLSLTLGTYYFVSFWYDPGDKCARLALNNGTPQVSSALSGTLQIAGTAEFQVGAKSADPNYASIGLQRLGYWNRLLTTAERTSIYNAGSGIDYPFV